MAGFYPDVPAPRMAYDRDGTAVFKLNISSATIVEQLSNANVQATNDEDGDTYQVTGSQNTTFAMCYIFPQFRDIAAYHWHYTGNNAPSTIETSTDTTNGIDGIWTSQGAGVATASFSTVAMRTAIQSVTWNGVKAVRFRVVTGGSGGQSHLLYAMHLYGMLSAGETPDRLRMWHPTLDEPLDDNTSADGAHFDWGDIQRNTSSDKTFRIKNNSATLTANSIVISQETLSDTSPTVNSQFTFSDGGAFAASIDIGNLAPGALSPVITKRFARPSNASLSLWTSRTVANPGSWT